MDTIKNMMDIIKRQFLAIMEKDPDYYGDFNIILSNEQQFAKDKDRNANNVYIVVKFMSGSLNYGQTLLPVNFNALGQGNKIDVCQRLLLEYAQEYNLGEEITVREDAQGNVIPDTDATTAVAHTYTIKQVYNPPQVMTNFNEVRNEFRSLFYMAGTFLIGKDSMPITAITYYDSEPGENDEGTEIKFVSATWDLSIQLDSQAFYANKSMTTSKSRLGTLVINVVSYFVNNDLCSKVRAIAFRDETTAPNGIKEEFWLALTFADGYTSPALSFHLSEGSSVQNIGEFPLVTMTFTN